MKREDNLEEEVAECLNVGLEAQVEIYVARHTTEKNKNVECRCKQKEASGKHRVIRQA